MGEINITNMPERLLQRIVHNSLSDPSKVRQTSIGKRVQILSPGRINHTAGPDYIEIAIMLDGAIVVGDAEFHRYSSDWEHHRHSDDLRYSNVILHIVLEHNSSVPHNFEVLIIKPDEIQLSISQMKEMKRDDQNAETLDDLQHFALIRILRKTGEAKNELNEHGLIPALSILTKNFLQKYHSGRKRPVYTDDELVKIANSIVESAAARFLLEINSLEFALIPDRMLSLIKKQIDCEGAHLRREIVLNCVLPLALAISEEQSRINLFLWFWSTPALHKYGVLSRKFANLPQNFLWQQQGMLEYLKEYGSKKNVIKESMGNYGFGEILNFYFVGKTPFKE